MYGDTVLIDVLDEYKIKDKYEFKCLNCDAHFKKEYGNKDDKHRCSSFKKDKTGEQLKWCFKCKEWLKLSYFQEAIHVHGGYCKTCRSCRKLYMDVAEPIRLNKGKLLFELTKELPRRKISSLLSGATSRSNKYNLPMDLTIQFLTDLWKKQNGKCYYSNISMIWSSKKVSFYSPSLDRKDPQKGYTMDNVVFAIFGINSFKQDLPYDDFITIVNNITWPTV